MTKILYVEDNKNNVYMLARRLNWLRFEIVVAPDGERGLAMARSERPELILMDPSLPILDGWEAARLARAGDPAHRPFCPRHGRRSRQGAGCGL